VVDKSGAADIDADDKTLLLPRREDQSFVAARITVRDVMKVWT
jgi:hypothetical protein